ncbi:MAG: lamin tail domain-containing protein [Verrucomicrobiales bacterium]|nr:lamin tail domain-containing protein [Verrucomicrobiales bacterium]
MNLTRLFTMAGIAVLATAPASADFIINEVDADTPNSPINDDREFVEIYGTPNTSLNGYVLVFFNGSNDQSYFALDLDAFTTNAAGFLVVGTKAVNGRATDDWAANFLQNGADAVALFLGNAADFPNTTPVATAPAGTTLVDAVVYDTADADDAGLLGALMLAGQPQIDESANGAPANESIQRVPDGGVPRESTTYVTKVPTPGATNSPQDMLSVEFSQGTIVENAGAGATTGTVTRTGSTAAEITVTLTNADPSEISIPATVVIPAGQASATFLVDAVNDAWADGTAVVIVAAVSAGYNGGSGGLSVQDDGDPVGLIVNEVHASGIGDANLDGTNANRGFDEFVEIVNGAATPYDLSGMTLWDAAAVRHTFPAGTVLQPGCALVVFGGGMVAEGTTLAFGSAWVQKANGSNQFGLSLNDTGDMVRVLNASSVEVGGLLYAPESPLTASMTMNPDLTGPYVLHDTTASALPFSPGVKNDGVTPFCPPPTGSLTLGVAPGQIVENTGSNAATLTVTRPAPFTGNLIVHLFGSDPSEATLAAASVTIPDGQPSAPVFIHAVDDTAADGTQTVILTAAAAGLLNGTTTLDVTDDGADVPLNAVYINEIDSDQYQTDTASFIELYDGGLGNRALDGFIVVLFNGANDQSYAVYDLAGKTTNAQGFFVIGNTGVPGVGLDVGTGDFLQNGADAVAVYKAQAASFPTGTPVTAADLVDAVVYGTDDPEDAGLIGILNPNHSQANEGPAPANAGAENRGSSRLPDATSAFGALVQAPVTPNATNGTAPECQFPAWAASNGIPGALPGDDADMDGIANLVEYALGSNPLAANALPGLVPSGQDFTVTFPKGTAAAADTVLSYTIQVSGDLAEWLTVTPSINDATQISAIIPGGGGKRFARLKVACP